MEEEFNFENGDIVIVKKEARLHNERENMLGIIVEQVGTERADGSKIVSLHLFNKEGRLVIKSKNHFIPEYVDYNTKELIQYKRAKETGYRELIQEPTKSIVLQAD